ncbi:hypothetical protein M427DRAFT_280875 [Gonapodya prolifera JEL478]|uniref:Zn(2)-C6 fungal-type domain-containing protein n=1 Tax=Gonapodya prolifera (strain JEL478) TaxID=1344416 RepID=A0A139AYQ2_GONPJ|nr:hypothetical protein M427DRAFT_280875 [Gonapodya prolifera JEL478]|eukprot:KXS21878.1 hypothetical protein M427DRAFT_280875 [Gonapodya prolifera JEL478]
MCITNRSCHRSKKRCDGQQPCVLCVRNGRECVYTKKEPKKRMTKGEYIVHLETRLRAMEAALAATGSKAPLAADTQLGPAPEDSDDDSERSDEDLDEASQDISPESVDNNSAEVKQEPRNALAGVDSKGRRSSAYVNDIATAVATPYPNNNNNVESSSGNAIVPNNQLDTDFPAFYAELLSREDFSQVLMPMDIPPPPREATSHFFHSIPFEMSQISPNAMRSPHMGMGFPYETESHSGIPIEQLSPKLLGAESNSSPSHNSADADDAISLTIKLRDSTTYFNDIARRRGEEKFDVVDFSVDLVERSGTFAKSSDRQRRSSIVADILASREAPDTEVSALVPALEKLGMNPSQFRVRLLRKLAPEEPIRLDLLQFFFENMMWASVIHPGTFFATLDHQSPLLLYSMYALATTLAEGAVGSPEWRHRIATPGGRPAVHGGERYFAIARRLLTFALEEPCLSTIMSLIFMSLYATGSGRVSLGWMYGGMSVRMVLELKWHETPDPETLAQLTPLEIETRKRTWWFVFYFDTLSSVIAGRPSLVDPNKSYVDFPDDEVWNNLSSDGHYRPNQMNRGVLGTFGLATMSKFDTLQLRWPSKFHREHMQVAVIFGRVAGYTKSEKSSRTSIGHLDERLCMLDLQLKEFWAGLSEEARTEYVPRLHDGKVTSLELRILAGSACLHILYHTTVILLHRPELTLQDFVWPTRTSFDVCTYAANRVAIIMERLLATEPTLRYFSAALTFPVFEAGMVHLMNALVSSLIPASPTVDANAVPATSPSSDLLKSSRRSVAILIKALDALRRFWASADAYYESMVRVAVANGIIEV